MFLFSGLMLFTLSCSPVTIQLQGVAPYTPTPALAPTLDTPERAIALYLEGLAQNDLNLLLQACAIDEMSTNFDFAAQVERLQAMILPASPAPTAYPFYRDLNRAQLTAQLLNQVKLFALSLLSGTEINGQPILNLTPKAVDQFVAAVDPGRLATLTLVKVALPNAEIMGSTRYVENMRRAAKIYGAAEMTERVALLSFEAQSYVVGFTLLRYGETWQISSQSSPLAGTPVWGTPLPMTVEEFDASFPSAL